VLRGLLGTEPSDIAAAASERWQVAPGSRIEVRAAKVLPGQLDRIRGAEFATVEEVVRDFRGGFEAEQPPTIGYAVKDVLLHDGVLYSKGAVRHLRRRTRFLPAAMPREERGSGAIYESWLGNRWFGNWLSDDCLTYRLADRYAQPVTTDVPTGHKAQYEQQLAMRPDRASSVWFGALLVFDDSPHNEGKRARALDMRRRLVGPEPGSHPGVFLLRNGTGDKRVLLNEREIAERLAARRGFLVIDPSTASMDEIVRVCGGARIVAGVEGSHLVHGLVAMPPGAGAFVIQPPMRAVAALKLLTDRQEQDFGFVVGEGTNNAFTANIDDVERTLDLF